ncbi:hypothetical protein [Magnetovibrio blakemorei]|uniref:DUF4136 domain-containing protein n=1 Tax=Magnetovibrio blakemorei TaxID=28181 RepID=A0A1E5Q6G5_9PROT|nr:hypothetical protein [Magnetovibrio blakemorei]OEJ65647.1 hypothetical protein BEN30_13900 [Magnetovibrio blakemorei]
MALLVSACAAPLKTRYFQDANLSSEPKVVALLTQTEFDPDIRIALKMAGFKVVKYASLNRVDKSINETTHYSYNEAEVKYGISVYPGREVDWCIGGDGIMLGRAVFELSDLSTNETLFYTQAGGWTASCGLPDEIVWDILAEGLGNNWK